MTKREILEKRYFKLSGKNVWIIKDGRYYKFRRVDNGDIVWYHRFRSLREVEEYLNEIENFL